jgi:hypothetical protein
VVAEALLEGPGKSEIVPVEQEFLKDFLKASDPGLTTRGTRSYWNGRTNLAHSLDADGKPNGIGGQFKYIDPKSVSEAKAFTVAMLLEWKEGRRTKTASVYGTNAVIPKAKEIYLFNVRDRAIVPGAALRYPISTDGMAFQLAQWLDANGNPLGSRPRSTSDTRIILDLGWDRSGNRALSYEDAFGLLTARGRFVTMGHSTEIENGAEYALFGEVTGGPTVYRKLYKSFACKTTSSVSTDEVLDVPVLGLHGLDIDLRHCYTARKGRIQEMSLADTLWETMNPPGTVNTATVRGNNNVMFFRADFQLSSSTLSKEGVNALVALWNAEASAEGFGHGAGEPVADRAVYRYYLQNRLARFNDEIQRLSGGSVQVDRVTYSGNWLGGDPIIRGER